MSEIIPILELVPVDLPRCDGCYWDDHENDICKEPNKDLEKCGCTTWTVWKEAIK